MLGAALGLALGASALRQAQEETALVRALCAALACLSGAALSLGLVLKPRREAAIAAPSVRQIARGEVPRVEFVDGTRIVVRTANGRTVLWRDQVGPDAFRRLAVVGRWCAGGSIR